MNSLLTTYETPKTKWQLAVEIEHYARALKYNVWGLLSNMTIHYEALTKPELKDRYENLKKEYDDKTSNK